MASRPASYPRQVPIDAYGNGGFRFADMSHRGSLLCLPSGIYGWDVAAAEALTPESLATVLAERARVSFLVLGTGARQAFPAPDVRAALAEARIGLEIMDTGAACRTYNVLLAEGREVAAALIAVE